MFRLNKLSYCLLCSPFVIQPALASEVDENLMGMSLSDLLNMPDVVESTSFFSLSQSESPGYTHIIDDKQIDAYGIRTVDELLDQYVPGLSVGNHFWTGKLVGTRGVLIDNNAKTLTMVDGQNINMRKHFGVHGLLSLPLMGDLAKIEVTQGPGAIVHGSGAINGFINMQPKKGKDNPGSKATIEYGVAEKSKKVEYSYGTSSGEDYDLFFYAGIQDADGFKPNSTDWSSNPSFHGDADADYLDAGVHPDNRAYRTSDPNTKLAAYVTSGNFKMNAFWIKSFQEANTFPPFFWSDPDNAFAWYSGILALKPQYTHEISEAVTVNVSLMIELQDYGIIGQFGSDGDSGGSESHYAARTTFYISQTDEHRIATGFEAGVRDFKDYDRYFESDTDNLFEEVEYEFTEMAIFFEDIWQPDDNWTISLGARYDRVSYPDATSSVPLDLDPQDHISPRVAGNYQFDETASITLSYQQGFRYPDAVYYRHHAQHNAAAISGQPLANGLFVTSILPDLEPETMDSFEINYHREFGEVDFDMNVFYNTYDKLLTWNGDEQSFLNASDSFSALGFELITGMPLGESSHLNISYGYTQPQSFGEETYSLVGLTNQDRDEWQSYSPSQIKANLTNVVMDQRLTLHTSAVWYEGVDTEGAHDAFEAWGDARMNINFSAQYALAESSSIQLSVKNLLEDDTPPNSFLPGFNPMYGNLGTDERRIYLEGSFRF